MNFSLIVPTRGRVKLLANLIGSIVNTTEDIKSIELLIAYDLDDIPTEQFLRGLDLPWLKAFGKERGNSLSHDYQNWLFRKSVGRNLFVLNDDVEFKTPSWDIIALRKIHPDGIYYGWTADSTNIRINNSHDAYACFPIIGRKAVEILGWLMHEYYEGNSADIFVYNVFREVGRIVDLSEILVQHYSHWLGNRVEDETNLHMRTMSVHKDIIDHRPESYKLKKILYKNILL